MSPKMTDVEIVERTIAQLNDKCDRTASRSGPQLYCTAGRSFKLFAAATSRRVSRTGKQPRQPVDGTENLCKPQRNFADEPLIAPINKQPCPRVGQLCFP